MEETYSHGFAAPEAASLIEGDRRTADILIDVLASAGVDVVFGLPGGAIAPLNDALLDQKSIRVVTTRHEGGAMFAAAAYARTTGKLGVVFVTSGPGIFNAMTGLASAHCDGLPVLVIVGEVPTTVFGRRALQEGSAHHLDVVAACRPLTRWVAQVPFADVAPSMLHRAVSVAMEPGRRGPVVLTIPLDVMSKGIRAPRLSDMPPAYVRETTPTNDAIDETASALTMARRPLILAGSGARWAAGPARLRELAEKLEIPVMTTPKAKGVFPESHRLSLGVFGYGGHPSAMQYLEEGIDALVVVGSSLGDIATNGFSKLLVPRRHFIQIDSDADSIGRSYPVTRGIVGDAAAVMGAIAHASAPAARVRRFGVTRFTDPSQNGHGPEGRITPMRALWELQRRMPENTTFTCDIGEHLLFAIHYLQANDPNAFMVMAGLGSMGSSIPGAVGAKLACPERAAVAVCGDGCFAMSLGDVAVAARERIPVVVAVLNDERYGMVELGHENIYGRTPAYPAGPQNVVLMARSVGAHAVRVDYQHEIETLDLSALDEGRPIVIDVRIDREVKMPKNARFDSIKAATKKPLAN